MPQPHPLYREDLHLNHPVEGGDHRASRGDGGHPQGGAGPPGPPGLPPEDPLAVAEFDHDPHLGPLGLQAVAQEAQAGFAVLVAGPNPGEVDDPGLHILSEADGHQGLDIAVQLMLRPPRPCQQVDLLHTAAGVDLDMG